nr:uncharacterized protein LOC111852723 [Paramormyrops kingsleyae]
MSLRWPGSLLPHDQKLLCLLHLHSVKPLSLSPLSCAKPLCLLPLSCVKLLSSLPLSLPPPCSMKQLSLPFPHNLLQLSPSSPATGGGSGLSPLTHCFQCPPQEVTKPPKFSPERAAARPKPLESGPQGLTPSALQTPGPRGATSPVPVLQQSYCSTENPRGCAKYSSFSLLASRCPGCILFISCHCIGSHRVSWHHVSTSLVSCHHPGSLLIPCRTPPGQRPTPRLPSGQVGSTQMMPRWSTYIGTLWALP